MEEPIRRIIKQMREIAWGNISPDALNLSEVRAVIEHAGFKWLPKDVIIDEDSVMTISIIRCHGNRQTFSFLHSNPLPPGAIRIILRELGYL